MGQVSCFINSYNRAERRERLVEIIFAWPAYELSLFLFSWIRNLAC